MSDFNEPWTIGRHPSGELVGVVDCNGTVIVELTDILYGRIAACVSACEGIPQDVLLSNRISTGYGTIWKTREQRNKLLKALKRLTGMVDGHIGDKITEGNRKLIAECEK